MENCTKVNFDSIGAQKRAKEINESNKGTNVRELRPYKCNKCGNYHLSSMTKKFYSQTKNVEARNKTREERFISREVTHWERKFNLDSY